jgi:hypothetical protein
MVPKDQGQLDLLQVHRPADREGGQMMAVLELYGKCKELGYCDCEGFFGCVDPRPPAPKPVIENELANAMKAEHEVSDYHNHNYRRELEAIEQSEGALVECEVCDRSHLPNHPHITNIEGDIPIDDSNLDDSAATPEPPRELPDWLKDKPGSHMIRLAVRRSDAEPKCGNCGKIKRSNHKCKGTGSQTTAAVKQCKHCNAAGELCARHGGRWADYDTPRGAADRAARELPKPVSVAMPAPGPAPKLDRELPASTAMMEGRPDTCRNGHPRTPESTYTRADGRFECKECKKAYKKNYRPNLAEVDPEIAAMSAIIEAVKGLDRGQLERAMTYIRARFEGVE